MPVINLRWVQQIMRDALIREFPIYLGVDATYTRRGARRGLWDGGRVVLERGRGEGAEVMLFGAKN